MIQPALTNYRPISVLTFFTKVFEKIVYNKLFNFISDNNILYDHQYGFRNGRSTQQAIITLVDRITKSQDIGDIVITLLIDLKKAFDTIIRVITFSQYLAHTNDLFVQLQILPFKKLVIHRIGLQMFKNNLGYISKAVKSLFTTNSDIHQYNTRNRDKMRSAYGKHEFMYSNFRFVGIHIWNYILDHLDINVTLPKFKKTFKTHILADNFTYHIF